MFSANLKAKPSPLYLMTLDFNLRIETPIQRQANDLQTLMTVINNYQNQQPSASDVQVMNIIEIISLILNKN